MLHEYHVICSIQYFLWFHVAAVGLGKYCPWIRWHTCIPKDFLNIKTCFSMYHVMTVKCISVQKNGTFPAFYQILNQVAEGHLSNLLYVEQIFSCKQHISNIFVMIPCNRSDCRKNIQQTYFLLGLRNIFSTVCLFSGIVVRIFRF
jgi:hypothetical protein